MGLPAVSLPDSRKGASRIYVQLMMCPRNEMIDAPSSELCFEIFESWLLLKTTTSPAPISQYS